MLTILQSILLGVIQGITEWLPVSSSGHLVIAQQLLNLKTTLFYNILLHFATLLVLIVVFLKDVINMLKALFTLNFKSEPGRLLLLILIGSIPIAILGFLFHDLFASFFNNLIAVSIALIFTGILLFISKRAKFTKEAITYKNSILIGIAQAIALIPGVSRSGLTISSGLLLNLKKETLIKFAFLLPIPAIIGALIFEPMYSSEAINISLATFIGFITAFVVGYISLKFLIKIIKKEKFYYFAYYCWAIAIVLLLFSFS